MAHRWERGKPEEACMISKIIGKKEFNVLAIGGSVPTGKKGIQAQIIEVRSHKELENLGKKRIQGKIVFFNEPMDRRIINPGEAYRKAGYQRFTGAVEAAKYGAIGVVVRSLTIEINDYPHTGITRYADTLPKLPAVCISTSGAEQLSEALKKDSALQFYFRTNCAFPAGIKSYNLIAEIKGSDNPEEVFTVGAHLDCWDVCEGANDDGVGCTQVIEALHIYKLLGIKPKRTIRFVLFMDEEMNQVGAKKYAETVKNKGEKIYAAFESDSGNGLAAGFGCSSEGEQFKRFQKLEKYFKYYNLHEFYKGQGDADIYFLKEFDVPLLNLRPSMQRYFEYHHCINDKFESISYRDLQLNSAAITSLIYLIDKCDIFKF